MHGIDFCRLTICVCSALWYVDFEYLLWKRLVSPISRYKYGFAFQLHLGIPLPPAVVTDARQKSGKSAEMGTDPGSCLFPPGLAPQEKRAKAAPPSIYFF